jgi:hypothetical protein
MRLAMASLTHRDTITHQTSRQVGDEDGHCDEVEQRIEAGVIRGGITSRSTHLSPGSSTGGFNHEHAAPVMNVMSAIEAKTLLARLIPFRWRGLRTATSGTHAFTETMFG